MRADPQLPRLYVEGQNDCRVICALLDALGTDLNKDSGPVIIEPQGSCSELLDKFVSAFNAAQSFKHPVGFVLDWDRTVDSRDRQVQARFKAVGGEVTDADFNRDGIIKEIEGIKVGVWLMPSPAAHSGTLEDFLRGMIPASDAILPKANAYVNDIVSSVSPCARFRDVDHAKAEMYSWLAVQKNPGESYALAIKSRLLLADAPMAREFHAWFCRLYDL